MPGRRTKVAVAASVAGVSMALTSGVAVGAGAVVPVVQDLNGPRGVATGPAGRVIVGQGDGTITQLTTKGARAGTTTDIAKVPDTFIAPAVARNGLGETFILTSGGQPGSGAATLYRWNPGSKGATAVKDIAAYQATDPDPFDLEDFPEDSNPFGVAALPDGSALVSDAAGNDLIRVYPDGHAVTVARIKPRVVPVPPGLPDELPGEEPGEPPVPIPPVGTLIPSEGVATSVTVGADGYYYLGELRGFPATPGTSQVWRIAPGTVNATCDPAAPTSGACKRYADGFTSIVDLGAARDGSIYVVELAKASWLQFELSGANVGGLFRIPPGGGAPTELAADQLILPGGVDVGRDGTIYVTNPVFGPGALSRIAE